MRDCLGRYSDIHGDSKSKLYRVWCGMKERCGNPHNKRYDRYGKRGISVCRLWAESYSEFKKWAVNNGYEYGLTLDRIDTDGNYEPDNCRWATRAEQNRNYSRNHNITYHGETKCLSDWADYFGINRATIAFRLKEGKGLDDVFSKADGRKTRWRKN